MNRVDRGPLLLIVAGVLLLLAVVACLISEAQDRFQRREAALRDRQALRVHAQRSMAELKAFQEESDRTDRARAELHVQNEAILKSLERIEKQLEAAAPATAGR